MGLKKRQLIGYYQYNDSKKIISAGATNRSTSKKSSLVNSNPFLVDKLNFFYHYSASIMVADINWLTVNFY